MLIRVLTVFEFLDVGGPRTLSASTVHLSRSKSYDKIMPIESGVKP